MKLSFLKRIFSKKKNRRPFKLTAAGWVFILYTVGVGAGAINTGNNLLYLIFGIFLGLILASGALSDMSLWGLTAECFWPQSVRAGSGGMIPVRLTNTKRFLPSICVTVQIQGELRGKTITARAYVPYIPPGGLATAHVMFAPEERGWFQVRTVRFQTSYPFGLLRKLWTAEEHGPFDGRPNAANGLFVLPAPLETERGSRPPASDGAQPIDTQTRRGDGDHIYGLREFRDADSPRRIHWKASAKRSAGPAGPRPWLVRETEQDQDSRILLAWEPAAFSALSAVERESAIRFGAGLLAGYESEGHRVTFALRRADNHFTVIGGAADNGDAWRFLSLWNPGDAPDGTENYLSGGETISPERYIDVMAAYFRWKETA